MGQKTGIEWTEATWNPIRGCSRVSEGCRNCYAETVAGRFSGPGQPYEGLIAKGGQWNGQVMVVDHKLNEPCRWSKPRMIFVNSMSDLFHENVPFEYVAAVFAVMASTPRHTYQILTKRPRRMRDFFAWLEEKADGANERYANSERHQAGVRARQDLRDQGKASLDEPSPPTEMLRGLYDIGAPIVDKHMDHQARQHHLKQLGQHHWRNWPLHNVWLGVSVEDQATADERIPLLLKTPAAVRWISAEPLLGAVDLSHWLGANELRDIDGGPGLDWVVVGGESGTNARPMHPDWPRSIRDQCQAAGVPFLFKQWGEWGPNCGLNSAGQLDFSGGMIMANDGTLYEEESLAYPDGDRRSEALSKGHESARLYSVYRRGKKKTGRELDGLLWDGYPGRERAGTP